MSKKKSRLVSVKIEDDAHYVATVESAKARMTIQEWISALILNQKAK